MVAFLKKALATLHLGRVYILWQLFLHTKYVQAVPQLIRLYKLAFYEYARIDLDSNRTKWLNGNLSNSDNSWVGVSPDDIWGSNETTAAYDLVRVDMLTTPTSGL